MPDSRQVQNNGFSTSSNASADKLDAMWRSKIQNQDNQDGVIHSSLYPDRPGEPDCIYYLRTGLCGYGSKCRFNHPAYAGQNSNVARYRGEFPERVGQPDCQYFLKTGTCKFGAACKYHHPRDRHDAGPVPLNILGLPMRQEEKSCPYYMRNGSCKFGNACKFHHPQPLGLPAWLPGAPYIPDTSMQGPQSYMPVVLSSSQGIIHPHQGWNTYAGTTSLVSSPNILGSNHVYNSRNQDELGSSRQAHFLPTSAPHFPEKPDQPECQYYMKTGSCKFGPNCKYNHPKARVATSTTSALSPFGLPLRPGHTICTFYSLYGICKFGSNCKFDHPLAGFYNHGMSVPVLSMPESPLFSYHRNLPVTHSSETSPSNSSRFPYRNGIPDEIRTKYQNSDMKAPEDPSQQAPSPTEASPTCMEHSHSQSDSQSD